MKYFKYLLFFIMAILALVLLIGYAFMVLLSGFGWFLANVMSVLGSYVCDVIAACVEFYASQQNKTELKGKMKEYKDLVKNAVSNARA